MVDVSGNSHIYRPKLTSPIIPKVSLGTRLAVITADIIALVVSWRKALRTVREASRLNMRVPLGMVLIRDGKGHFAF